MVRCIGKLFDVLNSRVMSFNLYFLKCESGCSMGNRLFGEQSLLIAIQAASDSGLVEVEKVKELDIQGTFLRVGGRFKKEEHMCTYD